MPKISLEDLCKEMIEEDYNKTKQKILLKESGFEVFTSLEDL
jgi:hypothetical protein